MKTFRLNRLFQSASGKCLDVAVDHGFFNEPQFLEGIEDMAKVVANLVAAAPDAIQLTVGQAPLLQSRPGKEKPALVLRVDVANVYGRALPAAPSSLIIARAVEQALRLDAACVVANVFSIPGQSELQSQCVRNIIALQCECERYAMPLMVEPLIFAAHPKGEGYLPDGDALKIIPLVRQAVELGADIIKADPTREPEDFHRVTAIAGKIPVLARGGGRAPEADILQRTETLMRQGAAGIVYGRNIIQHPNPRGMVKALLAIVHAQADAARALRILGAENLPQAVSSNRVAVHAA